MKALRWHGRGDLRLDDVPEPQVRPGWSVVEVVLSGVCGSDIAEVLHGPKLIRTGSPHPLSGQAAPVTLGHEIVGRVAATDSPTALAVGTRVAVDACLRCGTCPACRSGNYQRCPRGGSVGLHLDGGFARYVLVPDYTLVEVPGGVSDVQAALTEPFAVALHALDRAAVRAAESVLVFGFGAVGAACALVARALGGVPVVLELSEQRRGLAEALGFRTLDPGENLPRRVRALLGKGGADVVVDSTGSARVVSEAIDCATRGGRVVVVGLPAGLSEVAVERLVLHERSLVGSLGYCHDLPRVLRMVAEGRLDPAAIASDPISLRAAHAMFARLPVGEGVRIKLLIEPLA